MSGDKRKGDEIIDEPILKKQKNAIEKHPTIQGLFIVKDFITEKEEEELLCYFDQQKWDTTLKRRVQHYGYKYDYTFKAIDISMKAAPLPKCAVDIANRIATLRDKELIITNPIDQLIVNEYTPGQGISPHTDCKPCFQDGISSLSLGSECIMEFRRFGFETVELPLLRRSLVILTNDARYKWTHAIPARKEDNGTKRERRVSLTFRSVILK